LLEIVGIQSLVTSVVSPYLIEFETGVIEMTRRPLAMLTEMTWTTDAPLLSVMVKVSVKL
jgi:hypothetical protein